MKAKRTIRPRRASSTSSEGTDDGDPGRGEFGNPDENLPGSGGSDQAKSSTVRAAEVLSLAFLFPVAVYAGFRLGGWVGAMAGVPSLGSVLGGAAGAAAGFLELLRRLRVEEGG